MLSVVSSVTTMSRFGEVLSAKGEAVMLPVVVFVVVSSTLMVPARLALYQWVKR